MESFKNAAYRDEACEKYNYSVRSQYYFSSHPLMPGTFWLWGQLEIVRPDNLPQKKKRRRIRFTNLKVDQLGGAGHCQSSLTSFRSSLACFSFTRLRRMMPAIKKSMTDRMALREEPVRCRIRAKIKGPQTAENLLTTE